MNLKYFLFLLAFLKCIPCYSSTRDTIKLFYDINQKELSPVNKAKLDSINNQLSDTTTVRIFGFADYLGKSESNLSLSKDRADIVKNYLSSLHRTNVHIVADGRGEVISAAKNTSDLGEPYNRRVDVIIPLSPAQKEAIRKKEAERVLKNINNLSNLKVGESQSFSELTFQASRHFLNDEAIPYLQELNKYLKNHTNIKIEIQGHICCQTDGDGYDVDAKQNNLSVTRAKFIYDYLLSRGIKADRMRYKGLGSTKPKISPEVTVEDQNKNRRVEIVIISK